jgi:rare lipoprotein A
MSSQSMSQFMPKQFLPKQPLLKRIGLSLVVAATVLMPTAAFAQRATYYSDSYQGLRTASGERYDMNGYTAAHPTLPLGTRVRVTNLNNGRSVVVRVNDRCRCGIDLSRAAARDINLLHVGVAQVAINILN